MAETTTPKKRGKEVGYTETEIDEFLEGIDCHTLLYEV